MSKSEVGFSDGTNHLFRPSTEAGWKDGTMHKVKLIEVGGADGSNHVVWESFNGEFSTYTPPIFTGTTNYYDHGDYLYGDINGHTSYDTDPAGTRAWVAYQFPVKAGDTVVLIVSMSGGNSHCNNIIQVMDAGGNITRFYIAPSAVSSQTFTCNIPNDGIFTVGVDLGSVAAVDKWFQIFSLTINGDKKY
jgi:hypothetical protein